MGKKLTIDFSNIPDNNIEPGEYEAVINKVELKEGTKAPYLNWEFELTDDGYEGRKVWMITSLADNALFRLKAVAEQLGFEGGFELEVDEDSNQVLSPDFVDCAVTVKIGTNVYEGQKRSNVTEILDYHTDMHLGGSGDYDDEFEDIEDEDEEVAVLEAGDEAEEEFEEAVAPKPAPKKSRK